MKYEVTPYTRPLLCYRCSCTAERKPLPKEPDIGGGGKHTGEMGEMGLLDAQNEAATQVFNTESLETCEHCGRTFMEDR